MLSLFASLIEYFSFKMTNKNLIFSSLIGQIIAFRFIHFGYLPHQTYLLFSAIFLSILMIYILNKLVDILNKNIYEKKSSNLWYYRTDGFISQNFIKKNYIVHGVEKVFINKYKKN